MATATACSSLINRMVPLLLKRAPYVIYAKEAPRTLPLYDEDKDFKYYFFSDSVGSIYGRSPTYLTSNGRNAKDDHPTDYPNYFKDDIGVCTRFTFPKVKRIVEHWAMPAMHTTMLIRKTAMDFNEDRYLLGCFSPFDDVELGVTSFRAEKLNGNFDGCEHIPHEWFMKAFDCLPNATLLLNAEGKIIYRNQLVKDYEDHLEMLLETCFPKVKDIWSWNPFLDSFKFGIALSGDARDVNGGASNVVRTFLWRPDPVEDVLAMSIRPKHEILVNKQHGNLTSHY
mmetsp:Transcript_22134/g.54178  ORF Transcript_22134/g.54178 Transcript_22134/m.54178 type:complete len:283 (-) Transcript_22134:242-1090(-)|eukprot:CAMPEP_0114503932 /NCGR_PEP_ID=MMETSP0109-20121206/9918_1 /TAXON_ID=29199 /ORGANISM="Chlorarachnion reptans, Strain CCCM449" /LENGTH=282 /DNA_ID=CAMNT_0001682007 /DNA_START=297 /DNA_END=1145 /DNA_ORIENTATION=+